MTVEASLQCGGSRHTLRIEDGELVLVDHDDQAELSLVALGGEPPPCVRVLTAMRGLRDDAVVFGGFVTRAAGERDTPAMAGRARVAISRGNAQARAALEVIDALPASFVRSLLVPATRRLESAWDALSRSNPAHARSIETVVTGRAASVLREQCRLASLTVPQVTCHVRSPSSPVTIGGTVPDAPRAKGRLQPRVEFGLRTASRARPKVTADLHISWLSDVFCRGIALVDGAFVTRVIEPGDDELRVHAARWTGRILFPAVRVLRVVNGAWTIGWPDELDWPD